MGEIDNYLLLLDLSQSVDVVPNLEEFECSICFEKTQAYRGMVLRQCLHTYCKDCINNLVNSSEGGTIKCPYAASCEGFLLESEIRSVVSKEMYEEYLNKSISLAEKQMKNTYHCATPDCIGWWILEDSAVRQYKCPVCLQTNCMVCKETHIGISCELAKVDAPTRHRLVMALENRTARRCPNCQIIIEKDGGCAHMTCTICQLRFDWV